jgi:hypothetical protein
VGLLVAPSSLPILVESQSAEAFPLRYYIVHTLAGVAMIGSVPQSVACRMVLRCRRRKRVEKRKNGMKPIGACSIAYHRR